MFVVSRHKTCLFRSVLIPGLSISDFGIFFSTVEFSRSFLTRYWDISITGWWWGHIRFLDETCSRSRLVRSYWGSTSPVECRNTIFE